MALPRRMRHRLLQLLILEEAEDRDAMLAVVAQGRLQEWQRRRSYWVKPWLTRRPLFGQYETLFQELDQQSAGDYFGFIRMDRNVFAEVLQRVAPRITKGPRSRSPLDPGLKLVVTLRYLATGNSYKSLEYAFRVSNSAISLFIPQVCAAIYEEYREELFGLPKDENGWRALASEFSTKWNFHHCVGAIDGKHIRIKKPAKSGSVYFNYKGYFSLILLAIVDADYKFIWCNTGAAGSASDTGVFNGSRLRTSLEEERIAFPDPEPLPGDDRDMPYFLVSDDAFGLRTWMMKPYSEKHLSHSQRVFNYRLSRARRVVENAFGILANRWRCLLTCLQQEPRNAIHVLEACFTLHNLLRVRRPRLQANDVDHEDDQGNLVPGAWRASVQLTDTEPGGGGRPNFEGKVLRNYLKDYYNSDLGRVAWQDEIVNM